MSDSIQEEVSEPGRGGRHAAVARFGPPRLAQRSAPDQAAPTLRSVPYARLAESVAAPQDEPPDVGPPDRGRRSGAITTTCNILAVLLLGFALEMQFGSALHHGRVQHVAYAKLREQLALATAPIGPVDVNGRLLRPGAPIAVLDAPVAGIHEVLLEGTAGAVLQGGPGHRRDTVLPGQSGTSVVFGRQATYGGPFGRLGRLRPGDIITVTTGQGRSRFSVIDSRRPGDLEPPALAQAGSRLTLVTADGSAFLPSGPLFVDADLTSPLRATPGAPYIPLGANEQILAPDRLALVSLVLWSQLALALVLLCTWSVVRWGRWQTWLVAVPVLGSVGVAVADQAGRLLPNLM